MNCKFKNKGLAVVDVISWVAVLLVMLWLLFVLFFKIYNVPSSSMEPILGVGDKVLIRKMIIAAPILERNDIIVFQEAKNNLIKKIVGIPGDEVKFNSAQVFINGVLLVKSEQEVGRVVDAKDKLIVKDKTHNELNTAEYEVILKSQQLLQADNTDNFQLITLQSNEYFVLGENFSDSRDSRFFGAIQYDDIIGKILLIKKHNSTWQQF
jgi:signal peptidase I